MPRTKKAASRGSGKGRGGHGKNNRGPAADLEVSFLPFAGTVPLGTARHNKNDFSLQSEALNTQRHESSLGLERKLRFSKVNFVSAGGLEPSIPTNPEAALADMTLEESSGKTSLLDPLVENLAPLQTNSVSSEDDSMDQFIVDTNGTTPYHTGIPHPHIRSHSPTPSNSSDEVILFAGRDRIATGISGIQRAHRSIIDPYDERIEEIEARIHEKEELLAVTETVQSHHSLEVPITAPRLSQSSRIRQPVDEKPLIQEILQRRVDSHGELAETTDGGRAQNRGVRRRQRTKKASEDAYIADYIANMEDQGIDPLMAQIGRDLGGTNSEIWQETDGSSDEIPKRRSIGSGWDRSELCDFDDLSTSDEILGIVKAILSKRIRQSGPQYLLVWDGQTVDDARWVPRSSLTDPAALRLIDEFEAEEKLVAEFLDHSEHDSDSDEDVDEESMNESGTYSSDDDNHDDESDLIQRKIDRMTDERIARLLAKQEELGMGSNELILFDDSADDIRNGNQGYVVQRAPSRTRRNQRGSKRPRGDFPAASVLADAYDGFDVMDFERPSLKKKPKGRKGKLVFDLSDSELEASMQLAWENDREKKKQRKEDREVLRAQGLLGNKGKKADLKAKFKEGMGIHEIKDEIKIFLISNNTTLALPPMDKADRKIVHELANAFNLKSKSAGTGQKRFPVLYRTSRTLSYVESTFNAVEARLTRRFLPRMDLKGKRGPAVSTRASRGGGFSSAGVSYRDGDIVGGSAPELGTENRGRAMLEKMGWSTGDALGAINNKGILQPVSHVVKTTKAGLG